MKRYLKICLGIAVCSLSMSAWAATDAPAGAPMAGPGMGSGGGHPCKSVEEACKSAGFVRGGAQAGNGIVKDCMKPLIAGQAVKNISIPADVLAACKAKMMERQHGGAAGAPGMAPAQ